MFCCAAGIDQQSGDYVIIYEHKGQLKTVLFLKGWIVMEYSILIEKITEEDFPEGYYYAHIPSLDLTTHGYGIEGAKKAALELVTLWIQEKSENNEPVHQENESYFSRLEIINAL